MWRLSFLLLVLALVSGGLSFACESAAATGLAIMLFVAFTGLCAVMLLVEGRQARSIH
jgi:uncharacterized membrane protein YtjA (UPF0391 family)